MRTTLTIADGLLAQAKRLAIDSRRTLGEVVEEALRESLGRRSRSRSVEPYKVRVFKGTGPRPGINLDKTSELIDLTEKRHGPP